MKTKICVSMIFVILLLNLGCKRKNISVAESQDFSKEYIEAAISTNNVPLTQDFISRQGNKEEYIKMALEANSLDVLSFLLKTNFERKDLGESPYFYARSKEALLLLIKVGYSPNVKNYDEESLAEYYFKNKGLEFFKYFLQVSKDLDLSSEMQLPFQGVVVEDKELLSLMLQRKADFTMVDLQGNYPIYYAKNKDVISFLLQFPYDLELRNQKKENILGEVYLRVKREGEKELAQKLVNLGVNANYTSYRMKNKI